jgi:hypothetical protein
VAAVTARYPTESGTWAVAYLVLVAGVAQIALGAGQALLAAEMPPLRLVIAEFILWNCANTGVLAGTLLGVEPLIDAGGGLLVVDGPGVAHHGAAPRFLDAQQQTLGPGGRVTEPPGNPARGEASTGARGRVTQDPSTGPAGPGRGACARRDARLRAARLS